MPRKTRKARNYRPYTEETGEAMVPVASAPEPVHRLFALARERRVSTVELCALAGVHHDVVGRWKRGQTEPTMRVFQRVLDALDAIETEA